MMKMVCVFIYDHCTVLKTTKMRLEMIVHSNKLSHPAPIKTRITAAFACSKNDENIDDDDMTTAGLLNHFLGGERLPPYIPPTFIKHTHTSYTSYVHSFVHSSKNFLLLIHIRTELYEVL